LWKSVWVLCFSNNAYRVLQVFCQIFWYFVIIYVYGHCVIVLVCFTQFLYVQPSFDKVVPPSFYELGLAELVCIYNELREIGKAPPVIDAAELQQDPEVLSELSERAWLVLFCWNRNDRMSWKFVWQSLWKGNGHFLQNGRNHSPITSIIIWDIEA